MTTAVRPSSAPGAPVARPFRNDDADWTAVRGLIARTFGITPPSWNWELRRWDGTRFHREGWRFEPEIASAVGVWTVAGDDGGDRVVACVHPEDGGDAYLELDPDHRGLEPDMLAWAEQRLAAPRDGRLVLSVTALDCDLWRRQVLAERGYRMTEHGTWSRWRRLQALPVPDAPLPAGYRLHTTSDETIHDEAPAVMAFIDAAFGRTGGEASSYTRFVQGAPCFRHDLNLFAVAPDGSLASHAGVAWDPGTRHALFEPVATHPAHLRRGLARSLIAEGMRRAAAMGAVTIAVETGDAGPANALYRACGFTEEHRGHTWELDLGPA